MERFYKLAKPDGFDFCTGKTINYRASIGHFVKPPKADKSKGLCSDGVLHASRNILDCFVIATIPCSAYIVEGKPYWGDTVKCGFVRLKVIEEIFNLGELFGFKYEEVVNPLNPLKIQTEPLGGKHIELLRIWSQVCPQIWSRLWDQIWSQLWAQTRDQVPIWDQVWIDWDQICYLQIWAQVCSSQIWAQTNNQISHQVRGVQAMGPFWNPISDQIRDQIYAYIGSLFPGIKLNDEITYPFQSISDLWKSGYVTSYDGKTWRLHAGEIAEIVYEL